LGRAAICSHRLSTQTVSGTVWRQFAMQVLSRSSGERGGRGTKMGSLSSPMVTSYRLHMVTMPASHSFHSAPTCHGIGLAKYGNFIGHQTVELGTEIDHWFTQKSIATVHRSKERSKMKDRTLSVKFFFTFV